MKMYCKNVDITDRNLIAAATYDCLAGGRSHQAKYKRNDAVCMFSEYMNTSPRKIRRGLLFHGKAFVSSTIEVIIDDIQNELKNKQLSLKPIRYISKYDSSCLKQREIGIQNIKQQIYDYIAVYAMNDILRRIGKYQCAALPDKGQLYGVKAISKWLKDKSIQWAAKADVKKCYPSITKENMMKFLRKYIRNDDLLWLLDTLLSTFKQGLSIGSYLSQYLCNLYMSQLYHKMTEEAFTMRRNVRHNLCSRVLFYADDILLLGTHRSKMMKAMKFLIEEARSLGLVIKETWRVWNIDKSQFIDMMGYRIYRDRITIRRRIFRKIRRTFVKLLKLIRTHKRIPFSLAKRGCSYIGILTNTNSLFIRNKMEYKRVTNIIRKVVAYESRVLYRAFAEGQASYAG